MYCRRVRRVNGVFQKVEQGESCVEEGCSGKKVYFRRLNRLNGV